jgi:FtsP/CotA-like multicopper oxidase with cupredoxin domain
MFRNDTIRDQDQHSENAAMILHGAKLPPIAETQLPPPAHEGAAGMTTTSIVAPRPLAAGVAAVLALLAMYPSPARAQNPSAPVCPTGGDDLITPPEIVSVGNVLKGTIAVIQEHQRLWTTQLKNGQVTCRQQLVRLFRICPDGSGPECENAPKPPKAQPPVNLGDPLPGPTLRAAVGDLINLTFVNLVNYKEFDLDLDREACQEVASGATQIYPGLVGPNPKQPRDLYPNCLHASSTANIHFHGTHTNPNSTGDNVYLQIRPLPRDGQGKLTTSRADASASLDNFFKYCADQLKNPLLSWPVTWSDYTAAGAQPYVDKQTELLKAYQAKTEDDEKRGLGPAQKLWDLDKMVLDAGGWPQYYIGVVPYCYTTPIYTAPSWPPPPGSTSPIMGQAPGTHWYHAHKHGSTAINVMNGMTGAFIIEGPSYDGALNAFYGKYQLKDGKNWNTRAQPTLVLNTLGTTANLLTPGPAHSGQTPAGIEFSVNGRRAPKIQMQPGEVQLWRIVNTSSRNAIYFMAPSGFEWRQIAQDGVQFSDDSYQGNQNHPFYLAPANRADILVRAPTQPGSLDVRVQNVMGRSQAKPTPANATPTDPMPGYVMMTINVAGPPIAGGPMPFPNPLSAALPQPSFLADITDKELIDSGYGTKTFTFNSLNPGTTHQHTINGIQWESGPQAHIKAWMNTVEEWTVKNTTHQPPKPPATAKTPGPGIIDHPFHIHINPFQVTEFFDPNENLTHEQTGQLIGEFDGTMTKPVPMYVFSEKEKNPKYANRQCVLDPLDEKTWVPCHPKKRAGLVWWDVFAIPSGRPFPAPEVGQDKIIVPGYYKMRSRFVDYPGLYVFHCHILIHEDRGMMFAMEVVKPQPMLMKHH